MSEDFSLRPDRRHELGSPHVLRIERFDGPISYLTCRCGATAELLAGSPERDAWWDQHKPGHS